MTKFPLADDAQTSSQCRCFMDRGWSCGLEDWCEDCPGPKERTVVGAVRGMEGRRRWCLRRCRDKQGERC